MAETREEIMDCAEDAIRSGGYGAFSFRTIAETLQIKSASVHYHFPTKDALVVATTERYHQRFFETIGESGDPKALDRYTKTFQSALEDNYAICLCGVLASEGGLVSEGTREVLKRFARENLDWLTTVFIARGASDRKSAGQLAKIAFSSLEGAIIFASISGDRKLLSDVAKFVRTLGSE